MVLDGWETLTPGDTGWAPKGWALSGWTAVSRKYIVK